MRRSIIFRATRIRTDSWLLWLIVVLGALALALALTTTAAGGTAYYSFEGYLAQGTVPTQYFAFEIDRGIARGAPFSLRTWHYAGTPSGQTNAAGDIIPGGSFDPILRLYQLGGSTIVTNDDGPFGRDSLINWSTPGMPAELGDGSYGVDLFPFSGNGYWAVDLEADAARFTLTDAGGFGSDLAAIYSLKIGSDDPRVPAMFELASSRHLEIYYYHDLFGRFVVGKSGAAIATIEGDLDTGHSVLGWEPGSVGSIILDYGDWEDHHTYDATYVGLYGDGNLDVRDHGSAIFDYNLVLAEYPGSEGNVTISGPYAYVKVYSNIEIGAGGVGILRVENQGHLNSYLLGNQDPDVVASLALSTGTVDIDGYESLWETDPLVVGLAGQGTVRVTNGGKIDTHGSAYIGKTSSAAASSVTVTGLSPEITKATWLIDRNLHIAGDESGPSSAAFSKLTINTGGQVHVAGTTTVWNGGGSLELRGGEMETGSLIVKPGATFRHTDGTFTVNGGVFDLGTGTADYVVTGADSSDRPKLVFANGASGTLPGLLTVGRDNFGELRIENQATLRVGNLFASDATTAPATSKVTVAGNGSRLIITGPAVALQEPLLIGATGPGELTIQSGGQVEVQHGGVWLACCEGGSPSDRGSGSIVVEGQNSRLDAEYFAWFAAGVDSEVRIRDRGVVHATDVNQFSHIAPESSHTIDVEVSGLNSLLQIDGGLIVSGYTIGSVGQPGSAQLNIRSGGRAQVAHDFWLGGLNLGAASGTTFVELDGAASSATLQVGGALYVGGYDQGPGGGAARLTVANGGQVVAGNVKVWQPGTVELDGGIISTSNLELAGGALRGDGVVIVSGQLTNSGLVSPGLSAGEINISGGNFLQTSEGTLAIEIGGTNPFQYDQVNVTSGWAHLNGTLAVSLIDPAGGTNPYVPNAGDMFHVVTAAGNVGFSPNWTSMPSLRGGLYWWLGTPNPQSLDVGVSGVIGDYNRNGVVDAADYVFWRYLLSHTTSPWYSWADGDGNGYLDTGDYAVWRAHFGQIAPPTIPGAGRASAAIPEPGICLLAITAIFMLAARTRSCRNRWAFSVLILIAGLSSVAGEARAALTGRCYNGWAVVDGIIDFSGTSYVADRQDPNLDYWNGQAGHVWRPVPGSSSNYGVEWYGYVRIGQPGQYGFGTISDDGSQVWIDGALVVDNHELQWYDWEDNISEGDTSGVSFPPLELSIGFHAIRVRWYEQYSYSGIELWWLPPGAGRSDIPYYGTTFHGIAPTHNPNTNWGILPADSLFTVIPPIDGDFNQNGVVDAADYTVWRNNEGTTNPLPNDPIGGTIGQLQYNLWRTHFGQTAGSGAGAIAGLSNRADTAISEPATWALLILACVGAVVCKPRLRRHCTVIAIVVLTFGLLAADIGAAVIYNAATDFSATTNPSGVWSYGWYTSPTSEFHAYPMPSGSGGLNSWTDPPITVLGAPSVFHNATSNIFSSGTVNVLPGQLTLHPGNVGQYSVVRWTAPQFGMTHISAGFTGRDVWGTTTDVHVLHNGVSLFAGAVNDFATGPPPFETTRTVLEGDTIEFSVGYGNGSFFNDTTSLEGTIVFDGGAILPGDYHRNGVVDAADYVVWRKNPGGIYTANDYGVWRAHFGEVQCFCPTFVSHPQSLTASVGSGVTFSVKVIGTEPLFYQWRKDLTDILNAIDPSYSILEVFPSDAGDYDVLSANNCATEKSNSATLTVVAAGDDNQNGDVSAADYVVWRNGLGTTYTPADYDTRRAHLGQIAGSESGADAATGDASSAKYVIPEPATLWIGSVAIMLVATGRRSRRTSPNANE